MEQQKSTEKQGKKNICKFSKDIIISNILLLTVFIIKITNTFEILENFFELIKIISKEKK